MLTKETIESICSGVDAGFADQIQFTQDLVQIPSQRGTEETAQNVIFEAMVARNLKMDRRAIEVDEIKDHPGFSPVTISYENVFNVVGSYAPDSNSGKSLILNGHIDVVPTGPEELWSDSPYSGHIKDGWMYGRGAGDMKAGLVANLYAFDAIFKAGYKPCADIYIQSVVEEECTGNGALSCLVRGYHANAAIIPEPTSHTLVRANVGVIWFQVEVRGRPAHVHESNKGSNAILAAYKIIQAIVAREEFWCAQKGEHQYFEEIEKPITINVGKIAGGDWASTVPAWCRFDVRMAIYPGRKVVDAKMEIEQMIADAVASDPFLSEHPPTITYNGFACEGYELTPGSEAEQRLMKCHQLAFDQPLNAEIAPAYLDGRVFVLYDETPALVYGPIDERIHGFDERVNIESIRQITKSIALFIADWCGIEDL